MTYKYAILIAIVIAACTNRDNNMSNNQNMTKQEKVLKNSRETGKIVPKLSEEERQAQNTSIDFYLWYCENRTRLNQDKLFTIDYEKGNYSYNYDHLEEYLLIISNSGLVSDNFIKNLREYIFPLKHTLKKNLFPIEEENIGFEADILLNTQDPYCPETAEDFEISSTSFKNDTIIVDFLLPTYTYTLVRKENKWLVDSMY